MKIAGDQLNIKDLIVHELPIVSVAVPNRVIPVRSAGRSQNSAPIWAS